MNYKPEHNVQIVIQRFNDLHASAFDSVWKLNLVTCHVTNVGKTSLPQGTKHKKMTSKDQVVVLTNGQTTDAIYYYSIW